MRTGTIVDLKVSALSSLAQLYVFEKRWIDAKPLLLEAGKLCASLRFPFPQCESARTDLKTVYEAEGRSTEVGSVPQATSPFAEVRTLNQEARGYEDKGSYLEAEGIYRQAITRIERNAQAVSLLPAEFYFLGQVLEKEGLNDGAEKAYLEGIEREENVVGPKPPASNLIQYFQFNGLRNLYRKEGRLADLEPIMRHALDVQQQYLEPRNPGMAVTIQALADVYREEGKTDPQKYGPARALYERALNIQQENLGMDHPDLLISLTGYLEVLHALHEETTASDIQARIDAIRKRETQ